jgi:hypothetical protein
MAELVDETTGFVFSLREGAPPEDELFIRLTVSRRYKPNLAQYEAIPERGIAQPEDILDAMLYDMREVEVDYDTDYHEILFPPIDDRGFLARTEGVWEIVDEHGTVWSQFQKE